MKRRDAARIDRNSAMLFFLPSSTFLGRLDALGCRNANFLRSVCRLAFIPSLVKSDIRIVTSRSPGYLIIDV